MISKAALRAVRHVAALYPASFRIRHGQALRETLQDQVESALQQAGPWRRCSSLATELANAALSGLRLRLQAARHPPAHNFSKGGTMFESLSQDARFALRGLHRQPGFAAAAIAVLAIGIGLNTAVFSLVNAYLLRPLPFPGAERLLSVAPLPPTASRADWRALPREAWQTRFPAQDEVIESLVAWDLDLLTLVGEEGSEAVEGAWVTPGYFEALGTQAQLGRVFDQSDAAPGQPVVAVISHGLWQKRFGGDPAVLGRTVSAFAGDRPDEAESFTIIGVLPADFWFINRFTGILPILKDARLPSLVKVRPGVTIERARQHLTGFVRDQTGSMPEDWQMHAMAAQDAYTFNVRPVLLALSGAVGLVLLLACANVAILLLVKALRRHREMVVRRALGASRIRLMRLLAVEGLALSLAAAALGSALGWMVLQAVSPLVEAQLRTAAPGGVERLVELHPTVLALSIGVVILTGLLFALAPAIAASGLKLASALNSGGRSASGGRRQHYLRSGLIVAEVALSLTLLIGAALMIRSAAYLGQVDLGFNPQNVLTANLALRQQSYPDAVRQRAFVDQLLPRVRALPQVEAAGIQASWPFQQQLTGPALAEGSPGEESASEAAWYVVSPGFLEALQVPLIQGRPLQESDGADSEQVVVVSQSLADRLWPGANPLGKRIRYGSQEEVSWLTVVGVAGDVRETLTGPEAADCFVPFAQSPRLFMFLTVRWSGAPAATVSAIRTVLNDIDATAALHRVEFMQDLVRREGSRPRFLAGVLGGFSLFAVSLALLGLGWLISYTVGQRRHEIAIRMALGAAPGQVWRLFLAQGGKVVVLGLAAGILCGTGLTGALSSQLHGVQSLDWPTFAATALLLAAAALTSVWISARRAEKTDPTAMLKEI